MMSELDVCVDTQSVACLSKESDEFLLNYVCDDSQSFVSLTMPVRAKSYVSNRLFPIFEMHLPEGYLLSVIKKHFSKLTATDDSQDIQALTLLGSKRWRGIAHLERFAVAHCELTLKQARSAIDECLAGMVWLQDEVKLLQKQATGKDSRGRLLDHFAGLAEKVLVL